MSENIGNKVIREFLHDGICHIRINRPEKKNAIDQAMYKDMTQALIDADARKDINSVVFSGQGSCFTAGNDIADFALTTAELESGRNNPTLAFLNAYRQFSKPLILAAHGDVVGIGASMLLHSDLVYASPNTLFSLPFVKLGLVPEFASSYLLPRLVGHVKAFEWLILGEVFGAEEALNHEIINKICEDPLRDAMNAAKKLSMLPPKAVFASKSLLKKRQLSNVSACITEEIELFSEALGGAEFSEAASAFFEKRRPDFSKTMDV